jgi:hypothetical protein
MPEKYEHPIVGKLVKDPASPPRVTILTGYAGQSSRGASYLRIYETLGVDSFVDVPQDAVMHREDPPVGQALHPTAFWVKSGTPLVAGSTAQSSPQAAFLAGDIAARHLAGGAGGVPGAVTAAASICHVCPTPTATAAGSLCHPCMTPPVTVVQCPSLQLPCATPHVPCPTHQPTICPICVTPHQPCPTHQPSLCAPCATPHVPCPTHQPTICPICVTPHQPCPTHQPSLCAPCATPHAPCPTHQPTICPACPTGGVCPPVTVACPAGPGGFNPAA